MGNVVQGGVGQAPARQAVIKSGLPSTVSALTINKVCGSGLKAVMLAAQSIRAGDSQVVIAGGQESMSNAPFYVYGYRNGVKFGDQTMVDGLIRDGLWCSFCEVHMGGHAEYTAKKAGITREMADQFSVQSHQKAVAAQQAGKFKEEIVPVEIAGRKGTTVVDADEGPRADSSMESLGKLKPAFKEHAPEEVTEPVVTAGNASSMNDGASAVVVVSEEYARAQRAGDPGPHRRVFHRRGGAEGAVLRADRGGEEADEEAGEPDQRLRPDRGQRGVRRAGAGGRRRAWAGTGTA